MNILTCCDIRWLDGGGWILHTLIGAGTILPRPDCLRLRISRGQIHAIYFAELPRALDDMILEFMALVENMRLEYFVHLDFKSAKGHLKR